MPSDSVRILPSSLSTSTRNASVVQVRDLRPGDWPEVASIYAEGIATRLATYETEVPTWEEWNASHVPPTLVALDEAVLGWAALAPTSARPVYAGVVWSSVYVAERARGRGIGRALLEELIRRSEAAGIWTLQAGVFPENRASVRLHEACGFRLVGVRERLGRLDGEWRDVLLYERRRRDV
jgi:L-amino acid N-acyltransferase YncA